MGIFDWVTKKIIFFFNYAKHKIKSRQILLGFLSQFVQYAADRIDNKHLWLVKIEFCQNSSIFNLIKVAYSAKCSVFAAFDLWWWTANLLFYLEQWYIERHFHRVFTKFVDVDNWLRYNTRICRLHMDLRLANKVL